MNHLVVCSEYPPAPSGGIGTYTYHLVRELAKRGETVHVIGPRWRGAEKPLEVSFDGKLTVHRIPYKKWSRLPRWRDEPLVAREPRVARALFRSSLPTQYFSWEASRLAERLVEEKRIDVIEFHDYEAPLYFFQLRRALGLGPKKHPPCIVHLHSPTELIARFDDWDEARPSVVTARRLEEFSFGTADAFLCPSHYLARQIEERYGIEESRIRVIPYPLGESTRAPRDEVIWQRGFVLYAGRLERRKGVLEWIAAAAKVAREYPEARFHFVGGNILGSNPWDGRQILNRLVPADVRNRFVFHGKKLRSELPRFLSEARIAVVPSRWENFPYTCVEEMASGLPVIASPEGGMKEMIEDEKSGWIAAAATTEGLLSALRRAMATSPSDLARMGDRASARIRSLCDNESVIQQQLEFRREVLERGTKRSVSLPVNLPWSRTPLRVAARARTVCETRAGIAVVIAGAGPLLKSTLNSLQSQSEGPVALAIVDEGETPGATSRETVRISLPVGASVTEKKNAGIAALRAAGGRYLGLVFLEPGDRLFPAFLSTCRQVLESRPEVGLVSSWVARGAGGKATEIRPCPSFPYQWLSNDAASFSAIRTEAFEEVGMFDDSYDSGYENWALFNSILAADWVGVTIPEALGESQLRTSPPATALAMRRRLLDRFREILARDPAVIVEMVLLLEAGHGKWNSADIGAPATPKLRYRLLSKLPLGRIRDLLPIG
jgi:glycosyltransferase involved in cell wall biosynthesis